MGAMSKESTSGWLRMLLFFVLGSIQTSPFWILTVSGSVSNLSDEALFWRLPFQPMFRDPGCVSVINVSGDLVKLKRFAVLPVSFGVTLVLHEFGEEPHLPLEVHLGADVLERYQCTLQYQFHNRKRLQFGLQSCRATTGYEATQATALRLKCGLSIELSNGAIIEHESAQTIWPISRRSQKANRRWPKKSTHPGRHRLRKQI